MSSANRNSSSGGVRNLRAMFENKGDTSTSPPSRGRSPADSDASIHSRPVSKVRASFVAVERPTDLGAQGQQWGLRKASDVSSMAEVKEDVLKEQENMAQGNAPIKGSQGSSPKASGTAVKSPDEKSKTESIPKANGESGTLSKDSATESASRENIRPSAQKDSKLPSSASKTKSPQKTKPSADKAKSSPIVSSKSTKPTDKVMEAMPSKAEPPARIDTSKDSNPAKTSPSKHSSTSPSLPRTPRTPVTPSIKKPTIKSSPNKPAAVKESAARSSKPSVSKPESPKKQPGRASLASTSTFPKAKPPSAETNAATKKPPTPKSNSAPKRPSDVGGTVTTGGFIKPRPRSPTQTVRLPASATGHTASSAAKTGETQPGSHAPGASTLARKSSTLKRDRIPPPSASTSSGLNKKASRASLSSHHPPAANDAKERPKSRVSAAGASKGAPDDSFLARMMRSTASSASKVHDKVEVKSSPPRRRESGASHTASTTGVGETSRRISSFGKKAGNNLRKSVGKNAKEIEEPEDEVAVEEHEEGKSDAAVETNRKAGDAMKASNAEPEPSKEPRKPAAKKAATNTQEPTKPTDQVISTASIEPLSPEKPAESVVPTTTKTDIPNTAVEAPVEETSKPQTKDRPEPRPESKDVPETAPHPEHNEPEPDEPEPKVFKENAIPLISDKGTASAEPKDKKEAAGKEPEGEVERPQSGALKTNGDITIPHNLPSA